MTTDKRDAALRAALERYDGSCSSNHAPESVALAGRTLATEIRLALASPGGEGCGRCVGGFLRTGDPEQTPEPCPTCTAPPQGEGLREAMERACDTLHNACWTAGELFSGDDALRAVYDAAKKAHDGLRAALAQEEREKRDE